MCDRADPDCILTDKNTFSMEVHHYKTYYNFHGVYESHVTLFEQTAPSKIHTIPMRPFWIHG